MQRRPGHLIWPSLVAKPSSEAVPRTDTGGEGAAIALASQTSLLQDFCGPKGGIPLPELPLCNSASAVTCCGQALLASVRSARWLQHVADIRLQPNTIARQSLRNERGRYRLPVS